MKLRLVMADDHVLVLEGIRRLLEPCCDIVAIATDGRQLIEKVAEFQPDIVLLDIAMPLLNGIEAARQMKSSNTAAKLIFVTQKTEREYIHAAINAGAAGYVLKQSAGSELLAAISEVSQGRTYISAGMAHGAGSSAPNDNLVRDNVEPGRLTSRQRQVLQLIAEGKAGKEIAAILDISVKTVEFHRAAIMDQLGLRTTAALTRYAIEHQIA
jgi:DNA-binding NarL/FixJ family response regulator